MKRGFLNSKKTKKQPLCEGSSDAVTILAPTSQEASADASNSNKVFMEGVKGIYTLKNAQPDAWGHGIKQRSSGQNLNPLSFDLDVIVRVPSVALTPPNERSSFCLFPELTTREITETPGYPQPVPKPRLPDLFHIKPASGMGLGVFAKHAIKVHELIFAERPLLVCPVAIPFPPGLQTKGLTEAEVFRKCINHGEGLLKQMVEMMTPEDAKTFRSLNNCHQESGETLFGIMRSNGIDVEITQRECEDERGGYAAIGKVGSRFNHNCMSNVTVDFDVKSFSMKYMAKRDIDAGEQIFYSYCDNMQPAKKRRKDLETYGFLCQCMGCVNATPESDKLRQELEDRVVKLFRGRQAMFADPKFNIRSLDSLLKLEKDVMKERLETHNIFPYLLYVILEGYMTLGNPAKVKGYEKKIAKYNAPSK